MSGTLLSLARTGLAGRTASRATSLARGAGASMSSTSMRRNDDEGDAFVRPGPPPLPVREQREFERLVREKQNEPQFKTALRLNEDDEKHPQYRGKPKPEFHGDTNPQTGEVGGPKNDPLQWEREWTFGGRSTE